MGIHTVMFDLDGTLIDSANDIQICLQKAYASVLAIDLEFDIRPYLGPTIFNIIKSITPDIEYDKRVGLYPICRTHSS